MPDGTAATLGNIEPIEIQEEMERSFLDYAMSVITSRALPDVRDGLKPVHRRILYGMYDRGHAARPAAPRSAPTSVGDVMGKYHPHGDQRDLRRAGAHGPGLLAAPPADRRPRQLRLARPQRPAGRAALHRGRLAPLAMELLGEIDEDTVDFDDTYDGSTASRSCCRRGSRTCWSTAAGASPSAWPPTSRRTTSARSSTPRCT